MNTETIKQIISNVPSAAAIQCIVYQLRDHLKDQASAFTTYNKERAIQEAEAMKDTLSAIITLLNTAESINTLKKEVQAEQ